MELETLWSRLFSQAHPARNLLACYSCSVLHSIFKFLAGMLLAGQCCGSFLSRSTPSQNVLDLHLQYCEAFSQAHLARMSLACTYNIVEALSQAHLARMSLACTYNLLLLPSKAKC